MSELFYNSNFGYKYTHIGTGTGLAGPARPFSAEFETKVCVRLLCGLVPRLNYCSKIRQSMYVSAHA